MIDYYGTYAVGNLRELRSQTLADWQTALIPSVNQTLWYYDLSQSGEIPPSAIAYPLGRDKDDNPLILYKIQG